MKLTAVYSAVSGLLKSKGISLYDAFTSDEIKITKPTAFLYPPILEKEQRVLYPNGSQVNVYRHYTIKLEITAPTIASSLCHSITSLIDGHSDFFNVKLTEVSLSKVTSLPHFFVTFTITDNTLEAFTKKENEMVFSGLSVYAFIDDFNLKNDYFTPHITLANGKEHYGESAYRGRVYTLKLRFSPALREGFIYSARSVFDGSTTLKIDGVDFSTTRLLNAEILSSDNLETVASLSFITQ